MLGTFRDTALYTFPKIKAVMSETVPMTAREIAQLSGEGRQSVNATVAYLSRMGILRVSMKRGYLAYVLTTGAK